MSNVRIPEALINLLRSRRFIAAVVGLLVMVLVVAVPQLEPLEDGLVSIIVSIILALLEVPLVV
jgi:hypothetical protein